MKHFSHEHPLILKAEEPETDDATNQSVETIECDMCSVPISDPFYSCGVCRYFLHKECAELPNEINDPWHLEHPLTLLSKAPYGGGEFWCNCCKKTGLTSFVYNCSTCKYDLDPICGSTSGHRVRRKGMEREMTHHSHKHPLILKAEVHTTDAKCKGCSTPISGPFYSCGDCGYYLHKVCAELPKTMNHPMHPQHPLTVFSIKAGGFFVCRMCREIWRDPILTIYCSLCNFYMDLICASVSHAIEDKCHQHPLIPLQLPISFPCHICRTKEEGLSYRCTLYMCPFWVHQNCTLSLPRTVKHSYHRHVLTFLQSVPPEYEIVSRKCDICYDPLSTFHCVYYCEQCIFFAHVSCAKSEEVLQLLSSRDQNLQPDGQLLALLPVQQKTSDLVSWFAEHYTDRDAITNLGFAESYIDRDTPLKKEIKSFSHEHPIFLIDDKVSENVCDACAQPLSTPSYGCIDCGYFLHKYCTELPVRILHPTHPQHQISLSSNNFFFLCGVCDQRSNGFFYECLQCNFKIDIKCTSLLRQVKHEGHKHPLIPGFISSSSCSACNHQLRSDWILQCNTCRFILCFWCAMAQPMIKHRWDEHPYMLAYSPPENHHNYYICDLCEEDLNPKLWNYHCRDCDQFSHLWCLRFRGQDSNIKYGKCCKIKYHEHLLTSISCTYSSSFCNKCRFPMRTGYKVGLECKSCDFRIHLLCALGISPTWLPN